MHDMRCVHVAEALQLDHSLASSGKPLKTYQLFL
jgi:hypothetical protein